MQSSKSQTIGHQSFKNDIDKKTIATLGIFSNSTEKALYACTQKLSKIAAAIHLVADVIDRDDALARSLRDRSVSVLQSSYRMIDEGAQSRSVGRMIVGVEELMSFVDIGKIARRISDMNADILMRELAAVHTTLRGEYDILSEQEKGYKKRFDGSQPSIPHQVLDDDLFDTISRERSLVRGSVSRLQSSSAASDFKTTFKTTEKDTMSHKFQSHALNVKPTIVNPSVKTTLQKIAFDDRNQGIIEIIKSHKNATIADIKKRFNDMSDKTIQRALAKLIQSGAIVRTGNKRWATYSVPM